MSQTLFIPCQYEGNQLAIIRAKAEGMGFSVVTGEDLFREDTITVGLLKRIFACTHFLGVWSREGAEEVGPRPWPSPWLLWEFGVAEAFGLTWRLLISNQIDVAAWKRVAPHRQHAIFGLEFETKLEKILDVLSVGASSGPFASRRYYRKPTRI